MDYLNPTSINGLNLYAYCNNDPVNYYDPSGHIVLSIAIILALIAVGTIAGGTVAGIDSYNNGNTGWDLAFDIAIGALIGGAIGAICIFAKVSRQSGKTTASDKPNWVNESMVDLSKTAQQNANSILNSKCGSDNWVKGPKIEFNKVIKWIERFLNTIEGDRAIKYLFGRF